MRAFRILVATTFVLLIGGGAAAAGGTAGKLPAAARYDCGDSGVAGTGFTVYVCASGAGGTRYAHPAELLVIRANGSYTGYRNTFSQADLIVKSATGEIIASHNDSIVRVTASSLTPLVDARRLNGLFHGNPPVVYINALTMGSSGNIFFRVNYYAADRHGCRNARVELTTAGRLKLLWRSAAGLTCG